MAKISIMCRCEKCGAEFEYTHKCLNRREADNYEIWARENITVCPDCYSKKETVMSEVTCDKWHEAVEMHYSEYKDKYEDCETVQGSYNNETKTIVVLVPTREEQAAHKICNATRFNLKQCRQMTTNIDKFISQTKVLITRAMTEEQSKECHIILDTLNELKN